MSTCVSMWFATLADTELAPLSWLDIRERERYARFSADADRARFVLGATLLRAAVGSTLGVSPSRLLIDRECPGCGGWHGRPRFPGLPIAGSVSHSGLLVAVALATVGRVGIDVEAPRRDAPERLRQWVRQEARTKAGGGVLRYREVDTPVDGYVAGIAFSSTADRLDTTPRSGADLLRQLAEDSQPTRSTFHDRRSLL